LHLSPRDVDADHDIDLVITTLSGERVGVWLNDGRGQFTEGVSAQYPEWIWHEWPNLYTDRAAAGPIDCACGLDHRSLVSPDSGVACQIRCNSIQHTPSDPFLLFLRFGTNHIRPPPHS